MGLNTNAVNMDRFLEVLGQECGGATTSQLSMFDIGEKIGLEREEAGRVGEEIIAQGWAEIRTLAGDIGITEAGLAYLSHKSPRREDSEPSLGSQPLLDESQALYLNRLTAELKVALGQAGLDFETLAEVVADLRCLEAQMISPRIKTDIVRSILTDIVACLSGKLPGEIIPSLKQFIT